MARLVQIVVDCDHPAALARFWTTALDEFHIREYDTAEIDRLAHLGFTPETDPVVILDGPHVEICFQRIAGHPITGKRPLHLDIASSVRQAEVERLVAVGASIVEDHDDHTWMRDPEGNDFCVTDG